jgi:hypothetical protein
VRLGEGRAKVLSVSAFRFSSVKSFFPVFHISPHPFRLRVLLFFFFLSIYPARLSRSLCLKMSRVCLAMLYFTLLDYTRRPFIFFPTAVVYVSMLCTIILSSPPSFPQSNCYSIDVLSTIHPSILHAHVSIHHCLMCFFCCYATSTYNYDCSTVFFPSIQVCVTTCYY